MKYATVAKPKLFHQLNTPLTMLLYNILSSLTLPWFHPWLTDSPLAMNRQSQAVYFAPSEQLLYPTSSTCSRNEDKTFFSFVLGKNPFLTIWLSPKFN